jgi:hypothetical protein
MGLDAFWFLCRTMHSCHYVPGTYWPHSYRVLFSYPIWMHSSYYILFFVTPLPPWCTPAWFATPLSSPQGAGCMQLNWKCPVLEQAGKISPRKGNCPHYLHSTPGFFSLPSGTAQFFRDYLGLQAGRLQTQCMYSYSNKMSFIYGL